MTVVNGSVCVCRKKKKKRNSYSFSCCVWFVCAFVINSYILFVYILFDKFVFNDVCLDLLLNICFIAVNVVAQNSLPKTARGICPVSFHVTSKSSLKCVIHFPALWELGKY